MPAETDLTVADLDPELLAREANGAIQVELPLREPLLCVLGGPIKIWWEPGMWDTPEGVRYRQWRDAVEVAFKKAGFLCYTPHKALSGAWWEPAQQINDTAIRSAGAFINMTPPGIRADGTAAELDVARAAGTPIFTLPPGTATDLAAAIAELSTWPARPARPRQWLLHRLRRSPLRRTTGTPS